MTTFALPRPTDWRLVVVVLVAAASLGASIPIVLGMDHWLVGDWDVLTTAGERITAGVDPYGDSLFRYSPLVAYAVDFIAPIGKVGWTLVGFASLALLRDWRLIALFLAAVPWWLEMATGLSMAYVPILTILALRGSLGAGIALAAVAVLVPRPMMVPIVGYLLWQRPELRLPSLAVMAALVLATLATGWADEWAGYLVNLAGTDGNVIPLKATLGVAWFALLPFGAWLAYHGHLGLAALAVSPYWTAGYLLMPLIEISRLFPKRPARDARLRGSASEA